MDWKKKTMLIYIIGGLAIGIVAGMISVKKAVDEDREIDLSLQDGAKMIVSFMFVPFLASNSFFHKDNRHLKDNQGSVPNLGESKIYNDARIRR